MKVPMLDTQAQHAPIAAELRAAFDAVLASGQFVLGPEVVALEAELAELCGCKHAIGLSSGTDALIVAMMAGEIGPGDEVIVPDFTFFATGGCVARVGATPVFCDIEPDTFNINIEDAHARITSRTKAIVPVHLYGQCANMDAINALAKEYGLLVVEDAAQAIGAVYQGTPAGALGDMAAFSFYPTKNLGALGDAGMLTTNNDALAERAKLVRIHGAGRTYKHDILGGNFRMDAFHGAMLRVKLRHLAAWNARRAEIACAYLEGLKDIDWLQVPVIKDIATSKHVWHQFTLRIAADGLRDKVRQYLNDAGIASGIYYPMPLSQQECFANIPQPERPIPEAQRATEQCLSLPIHADLSDEQVALVVDALRGFTA